MHLPRVSVKPLGAGKTVNRMKAKKKAKLAAQESADPSIDARFLPIVEKFARDPRVSHGRLMSSYGLKLNGKIFAMVVRGKLVVKLPRTRVDELVAAGSGRRFDPGHGRLMKEWVSIESAAEEWFELAREAYDFVSNIRGRR